MPSEEESSQKSPPSSPNAPDSHEFEMLHRPWKALRGCSRHSRCRKDTTSPDLVKQDLSLSEWIFAKIFLVLTQHYFRCPVVSRRNDGGMMLLHQKLRSINTGNRRELFRRHWQNSSGDTHLLISGWAKINNHNIFLLYNPRSPMLRVAMVLPIRVDEQNIFQFKICMDQLHSVQKWNRL